MTFPGAVRSRDVEDLLLGFGDGARCYLLSRRDATINYGAPGYLRMFVVYRQQWVMIWRRGSETAPRTRLLYAWLTGLTNWEREQMGDNNHNENLHLGR
jgi:hypothetical protein